MTCRSLACWALAALGAIPAQAAQRAYVASYGNDVNAATGCLLASPCRSFSAALTVVDAGGEIVALDAAGYGTVNVQKSVTITANDGFFAGIAAASGTAVTIGQPGIHVKLRNLNINGTGADFGVAVFGGARATIENCVISNFAANGIDVTGGGLRLVSSLIRDNGSSGLSAADTVASVSNTTFIGNGGYGVDHFTTGPGLGSIVVIADSVLTSNFGAVQTLSATGSSSRTTITGSTASNNLFGISSETNETLAGTVVTSVAWTQVTGNEIVGLVQFGTAVLETLGNNHVRQNGTDVSGVLIPVAGT